MRPATDAYATAMDWFDRLSAQRAALTGVLAGVPGWVWVFLASMILSLMALWRMEGPGHDLRLGRDFWRALIGDDDIWLTARRRFLRWYALALAGLLGMVCSVVWVVPLLFPLLAVPAIIVCRTFRSLRECDRPVAGDDMADPMGDEHHDRRQDAGESDSDIAGQAKGDDGDDKGGEGDSQ